MRGVFKVDAPSAPASTTPQPRHGIPKHVWLLLAGIVVATVVCYSPVLFNFFVGDDFVHLIWLKEAVKNPELIWRNFHSSWLDGTTTKFYRPLISVFMVTDYLAWGINGLGFHLTNLAFHLAGSLFLFAIVRELTAQAAKHDSSPRMEANNTLALAAAGIFALYPLHPEAVSWITGRVDSIVTTFCLAQFWFYLKWRTKGGALTLTASIVSFVLGLTSKEMAITVPAVLCAYEFFYNMKRTDFVKPFVCTLPFWTVFAGYFVVRRIALGTFVGGYDDSLLFIADLKAFALGWLHALRMTVEPLNRDLIGSRHWLTKAWEILAIASVALGATRFIKGEQRRTALFSLAWLALALIPVYKLFAISDDLQGSRLAYLATVPLSMLFAYGITYFGWTTARARVAAVATVAFLLLCGSGLWINNQPWRQAGLEANAIRAELADVYAKTEGDPQTLVLGLPDQIHGAYVARNALWGMTKVPQLSRNIENCLSINPFEPIFPFGFVKASMVEDASRIRVFDWNSASQRLKPIALPSSAAPTSIALSPAGIELAAAYKRPQINIGAGKVPCWNIDFVRVNLNVSQPGTTDAGADLLYANDISPQFKLPNRVHCSVQDQTGNQSLLFALHALPEWSFGTSDARLKLLLPPGCDAKITSVETVPSAGVMPTLNFDNSGYLGSKGYFHLGHDRTAHDLTVDASSVKGAAATSLEITRPNLLFEEQNCTNPSKYAGKTVAAPLTGTVTLHFNDFPTPGIYELRAWAKDKSGKTLGVASDHIVIAVDP